MGETRFRMSFDGRDATLEELALVEEIVVEQEMDTIWEARVTLATCLDEQGRWQHQANTFAQAFARVRVELDPGDGAFVPLIDGPVAQFDTALDSQPGRSTATLVVRDDSVFLHRREENEVFRERADSDLADELFRRFPEIGDTRVDSTATQPVAVRRGTVMQFLRELARANAGFHAYVLPGEEPGQSIGYFRAVAEDPVELPELVLVGGDRNLADATLTEDPEGPETTTGRSLRISDQGFTFAESRPSEFSLMGELPAVPDDNAALRQLPPADNTREEPADRTSAQARTRSFAFRLESRVVPGCYPAVLAPYRKVYLRAGQTRYSGTYLLSKVTHRITPSLYTQELEATSDAATPIDEAAGGIAGALSAAVEVF